MLFHRRSEKNWKVLAGSFILFSLSCVTSVICSATNGLFETSLGSNHWLFMKMDVDSRFWKWSQCQVALLSKMKSVRKWLFFSLYNVSKHFPFQSVVSSLLQHSMMFILYIMNQSESNRTETFLNQLVPSNGCTPILQNMVTSGFYKSTMDTWF